VKNTFSRDLIWIGAVGLLAGAARADELRIGLIGTDTSHAVSFAKLLNGPAGAAHISGARIVAAWKGGSPDLAASASRVEGFAAELSGTYGVKFYPTIEAVMGQVDAVMILSVDGRPHLDEARRVFAFHKPVFIDKPLAASLKDGREIFRLARRAGVPCFSSSDERFTAEMTELKQAPIGKLLGVSVYGPADLEPHHPALFWYGIHAVEKAYTLMGTGCRTVVCTRTPDTDVVTGVWADGRVATVRGLRNSKHDYATTAFGTAGIVERGTVSGYRPLIEHILEFYRSGVPPVAEAETVEILTFMEAADVSAQRGGVPVALADVLRESGGAPSAH
jgi:predicted dehydrogenase